ncbi:MAG: succinyl-diaminopimelate desuccinylase [Myxococcales bacterium]|nr:succinyl-diaminopimelate desuccinylase [Myxococcales bacterium]
METPAESLSLRLAQRALELIRVPSVIGNERALADLVEAWATTRFGAAGVVRVSHSLAVGRRDDPRPAITLVGHLDTVPENPDGTAPRLEGGRLVGLGSSDMKGSLAVMMALADDLPLDTLPFNLRLVFYEREEGPFLESGLAPLFDAARELERSVFAIAMEPTDGAVQVGCVGSLHARLLFEGQAAHSARPWQGKNAIHAAGAVLVDLEKRGRHAVTVDGHTFFEVMSATLAKGGRARNVVPDTFELNLNYRFAPGKTVAQAQEDVVQLAAGRCAVAFTDLAPSGRVCAANPHFARLVSLSGRPAEAKQAWTDVARLSEWGLDAVNYGPGETAQAHQRSESAPIEALGQAYLALEQLLRGR